MEKLLEAAIPKVQSWLRDDKISDVHDLVSIAVAYSQNQIQCPERELLENLVLKRAQYLTPRGAIKLVRALDGSHSSQMVEACDRIIGVNVSDITVSQALEALKGFLRLETREKIVKVLFHRISKDLDQFKNDELIDYAEILLATGNSDLIARQDVDKFIIS